MTIGARNRYTCDICTRQIITIDRDIGAVPFDLPCVATKDCVGHMYPSFYREGDGEPTHEWRKATPEERGLEIHPIDETRPTEVPFHPGDSVRYVPYHAQGQLAHEDCEDGVVSSINERGTVFVKFSGEGSTPQGCNPDQLHNFSRRPKTSRSDA